jgi:hypothetical protein
MIAPFVATTNYPAETLLMGLVVHRHALKLPLERAALEVEFVYVHATSALFIGSPVAAFDFTVSDLADLGAIRLVDGRIEPVFENEHTQRFLEDFRNHYRPS